MSRFLLACFVALLILANHLALAGETRYVTDRLVVGVRQSTTEGAPQLTSLVSGQSVEVLAEEGRYLKVRLADGREGFVLAQYFTATPPRATQVTQLEAERDALKAKLAAAQAEAPAAGCADLQLALDQARQEAATLRGQVAAPKQDPEQSLRLVRERDQYRNEAARLEAEVAALREEGSARFATGMIPWFLAGAGVLFVGWLVGKASRNKRRF